MTDAGAMMRNSIVEESRITGELPGLHMPLDNDAAAWGLL